MSIEKARRLAALAADERTPENEARNAAMMLARMIHKSPELLRASPATPFDPLDPFEWIRTMREDAERHREYEREKHEREKHDWPWARPAGSRYDVGPRYSPVDDVCTEQPPPRTSATRDEAIRKMIEIMTAVEPRLAGMLVSITPNGDLDSRALVEITERARLTIRELNFGNIANVAIAAIAGKERVVIKVHGFRSYLEWDSPSRRLRLVFVNDDDF